MIFFDIAHIGYGLSLVFTLVLSAVVYYRDRRNITNRLFALEILSTSVWIFTVLMADTSEVYQSALFWSQIAIIGPAFIPLFFILFSSVFPEGQLPSLGKVVLLSFPAFFFVLLSPTPLNVKDVKIEPWGASLETGVLYPLLLFYFLIYIGAAFYNFIKKHKRSNRIQKLQIRYILIGYSVSLLIALMTNLILVSLGRSEYSIFGPPSTIIFVIFTTYAIIKHHLFDVKVILTEILVGVIGFILFIQIVISEPLWLKGLQLIIFTLFLVFSYFLIQSILREIHYRKQLQKAYEDLKKLDIAKTEFISIASHQLRTPLTVIKGYISMILEGSYGKVAERAKKPMENVFKSNERLIRLVNDLLTVSKVETGKIEVVFKKASLEDLILELVDDLKIRAKKKNLYLKFEKPRESLPKILIDKEKIRQVILNILDNAIRYTQHGGITVKVQIPNSKIQILISDTGEGMTKGEASRLFISFARGSAGIRLWTEGAGLGLYVSKKYIDLHKGKIWAESSGKGRGSTFFIELPIK